MENKDTNIKYNCKAFFFDNDSTLFDHSDSGIEIHESTYEALRKLRENGYKTCMITSRSYPEMYNVPSKLLDLLDDVNMLSGGYNMHDGIFEATTIEHDKTIKAIRMFDELGLTYRYATKDGKGYLNQHDDDKEALFYRLYKMIPEVKKYENEEVCHLLYYTDKKTSDMIFESLGGNLGYSYIGIGGEIGPKDVDKGCSLVKTARKYGIDLSETCACGDGINDIPLFEKAGLSICMGNGNTEAKACADYVTDNIWDDGLYKALKHFGFID